MSVLVFGATGGTGLALIRKALGDGLSVKAFVRGRAALPNGGRLEVLAGDVMDAAAVAASIAPDDEVVVSLGRSKRATAPDVCEAGTRNIIKAMAAVGARRIVIVSAFGIGDTRGKASWLIRMFYALLLRAQMADKEKQERLLKAANLDWTIVQPVALIDGPASGRWLASRDGEIASQQITRGDVARFILEELADPHFVGKTVALSGLR